MPNGYKRFFQAAVLFFVFEYLHIQVTSGQTVLVDPATVGGFESGTTFLSNGWTEVNGTQNNKWWVGTAATGYLGSRGAHISNDASGLTHNYNTSVNSTVHIYRDITIPATETNVTIEFKWKNYGENADFLQVALCPTTVTPAAGNNTTVAPYVLGTTLKGYSSWTTTTLNVSCIGGTTKRLVFTWKNNNTLGTQPPAAIDSISVVSSGGSTACSATLGTGQVTVSSLPYLSTGRTTAGQVNDLTATTAYTCGTTTFFGCEDEVFIFTPAASGSLTAAISNVSSAYAAIYLYSACPATSSCSGTTCVAYDQSLASGKSICVNVTSGTTYYLLVDGSTSGGSSFDYDISISAPGSTTGNTCATATPITLPFTASAQTTSCSGNDYTVSSLGSCGTLFESGEDKVYSYTASSAQCLVITLSNVSSANIGVGVYSACPGTSSGICIGNFNGSGTSAIDLPSAGTYYIIVDSKSPPSTVTYDISIAAGSATSGTVCSNAIAISLPFSVTNQTTSCAGDDYNNTSLGSCGSIYESGEDKVYSYTASGAECLSVTLSNLSSSKGGFMVYSACPGSATGICIGWFGGAGTKQVSLPSAGTYYFIIDSWSPPSSITYDFSITSNGSGQTNDLPCNATSLTLGTLTGGDNSCSSGTGEPANTTCLSGNVNTVWYSFVAPSSGQVHVGFQNGTLTQDNIQLFSGTCSSLTYVNCIAAGTLSCPGGTFNGLTSGNTYYLRLDGNANEVGYYSIIADDNSGTLTPTTADCEGAYEICGTSYTSPDNSLGCGNVKDVNNCANGTSNPCTNPQCCNQGCWLNTPVAELNSRWFKLYINTSGTLAWTLSGTGTGYFDWLLWDITTAGCAGIHNNTLAPVRCNWNGIDNGMTGMQSPVPPGGNATNFQTPLSVTAGSTYMLAISNWSYTIPAYDIDFSNSTCAIGSTTTATWTGTSGTAWNQTANWSGCGTPSCGVDAIIDVAASQPVISSNVAVKSITINAGATLTINSNITLSVCGDFINNGTLVVSPNATVQFVGTGTQLFDGALTGSNKLGHVTITKTSGTVELMQDIDLGGSLTTSNSTSIINTNSHYIKIAGNMNISSGSTTFTGASGGTLEFNGTGTQTYDPGGSLTLNNVLINQGSVASVNLSGIMTVSGTLTLTSGRITTNSNEVNVTNAGTAAISGGGTGSYIDGYLRRSVNSTGSYDFPVGHFSSGKGFQKINIDFTSSTNVTNLLSRFDPYASVPGALGSSDCGFTYNMPALNNGYWTVTSSPNMISGAYTATLYNTAGTYSNSSGAIAWTVMKDNGSGWALSGTCATSTINQVVRTGLNGFSEFGTAQSSIILPVEFVSFTGTVFSSGNLLQWETASELNNDYFTVERSSDGNSFDDLVQVDAVGFSNESHTYETWDYHPVNGFNYYRLRQTDIGGDFTYSPVVVLENFSGHFIVQNIIPNPTSGDFQVEIISPSSLQLQVSVDDISGKTLQSFPVDLITGTNTIDVSLGGFSSGLYMLKLSGDANGYSFKSKVVKY